MGGVGGREEISHKPIRRDRPCQMKGVKLCHKEMGPDRKEKGRERDRERGAVEGKALSGQVVNLEQARDRERVKAAKAVLAAREINKDNKNGLERRTMMPGGDRTGPMGMGPMTGRAAGFCAGFGMPGFGNPAPGRGFGMGFGRGRGFGGRGGGRGWRRRFYATGQPGGMRFAESAAPLQQDNPEPDKQALKNQVEALQSELDFIKKRLSEMESGAGEAR